MLAFFTSDILTPTQLKNLEEHKYSQSGRTLTDPIVQPFWNWLVEKLPLWLAPNLMTISGLFINIVTSLILICYSPDCSAEAPQWAFALCAAGLFVYQTLDACDGKQARRTGSSSPLGELFDHGCDSLSNVFVAVGVCVAIRLGNVSPLIFFQCFTAMTLFYCAHWQTYVTGTLRFGRFDVTEAQFVVMIIYLISATFGSSIWRTGIHNFLFIPHFYVELNWMPVLAGLIVASFAFYTNLTMIFTGGVGKNGSTVAGTSILSPLVPLILFLAPGIMIYAKMRYYVFSHYPCLYVLAFGMVASKITNKLVVAHMTKSKVDYLDSVFLGPGILFLNQYFNDLISEHIILWICFVYTTCNLLLYCTIICRQICGHLHIPLFTINPMKSASDSSVNQLVMPQMIHNSTNGMQKFFSVMNRKL